MALIEEIQEKVAQNQFEFTKHALDRMTLREILVNEICEAIAGGEVIEDYPITSLIQMKGLSFV